MTHRCPRLAAPAAGLLLALAAATTPLRAQAEFRLTALAAPTIRNAALAGAASQGTGSGGTIELLARTGGFGVHVRTFGADLERGLGIANGDVRLLLGPQAFSVEVGGTRRVLAGPLATASNTFGRVGVRSTFALGGSGIRGMVGGWALSGVQLAKGVSTATGLEAETALLFYPTKLPVFVQLGYRAEALKVTLTNGSLAPEELGVVTLGGGLSFGGRVR